MAKPRLYYGPEVTKTVLRHIIKGASTQKELAERLDCAEQTVYNKVHDPKHLGFLEKENGKYVISNKEELMKLFQLDRRETLKKRFEQMPGVGEVNDELIGGSLSFTRVGRLISYYTDSEAIDEDAFLTYGRVYANWFDYLGMGYATNRTLSRQKPPGYNKTTTSHRDSGNSYPKVRPDKTLESLSIIEDGIDGKPELASHFGFSERQAGKLLGTCYSLNLAKRDGDVTLTDFGRRVKSATKEERKDLLREVLLEIELIETYYELAPDDPFQNQDLMRKVSEELGKDWSDTTVQTKAKRIYSWLVYTNLFKEVRQGILELSATAERGGLSSIDDYA